MSLSPSVHSESLRAHLLRTFKFSALACPLSVSLSTVLTAARGGRLVWCLGRASRLRSRLEYPGSYSGVGIPTRTDGTRTVGTYSYLFMKEST